MAKLKLKESCYNGIENVVEKKIYQTDAHNILVRNANEQIEKNRIRYATAYNQSGASYFSN